MKRLADKLKLAGGRMMRMGKKTLELAVEYTMTLALLGLICLAVLKAPEVQNHWYRATVATKVYMIRDSARSGGGSGFAVKAPSGQTYILTNDHVCGVSKDGRTVLVTGPDGQSIRRNIIAHDDNSDLCLIEGMPGVSGLEVAWSTPEVGDMIRTVGHPRLMPTHVSVGELTGFQTIQVGIGPISVTNPRTGQAEQVDPERGGILPEQCMLPKHSQEDIEIDMMFFVLKVKFCVLTVKNAYTTSVIIHPGNSGSPVINFWGNVVGVVFASDDTNWGRMVPLHDVKAFLSHF